MNHDVRGDESRHASSGDVVAVFIQETTSGASAVTTGHGTCRGRMGSPLMEVDDERAEHVG